MRTRNQKGLATWVKVLLAVVALGFVVLVGLGIAGFMFVTDLSKKATKPEYVKEVTQTIAKIDELPSGFKYQMGIDAMGMSIVALLNEDEKLSVMLMKLPQAPGAEKPDQIVDKYAERGVPTVGMPSGGGQGTGGASPMQIKDKGKLTVGGEEMPYAIGESEIKGTKVAQLIGCVVPKAGNKTVLFIGQTLDGSPYKMEPTKQLLSSIKGF